MQFKSSSTEDLTDIAKALLQACKYGRKFAFYGAMGTGKTTFIKVLCQQLGCQADTSSPTFSIVNEYYSQTHQCPVFHMDLYRLRDEEELLDIGLEDYLDLEGFCFIEWPELAEPFLDFTSPEVVRIDMETAADSTRVIQLGTTANSTD